MNSAFRCKKIILISSERREVQKVLNSFRKNTILTEDIFWLKDLQQVIDYLRSEGRYAGKAPDNSSKAFILDNNFAGYEKIRDIIASEDHLKKSLVFDLSVVQKEVLDFMEVKKPHHLPKRERILFGFYHRY